MGDGKEAVQEARDPAEDSWTWQVATAKAEDYIQEHGLPAPKKPVGLGMEYDFPTDARSLGSEKLGGLRLMLSAYHGYALWLTGKEEVELDAFKAVYDMLLGRAMDEAQRAKEKRAVKEILRSVAIMENEDLKRLTRAIIEREARVGRLKNQLAIYEAHLSTLSREQSRRESEARTGII